MNQRVLSPDPPFERVLFEVASRLSGAIGTQVYEEVARAAAALVGADMAVVGFYEPSCEDGIIMTAAVWQDGRLVPNFSYPLRGTPCCDVVGRVFLYFRTGVSLHYPDPQIVAAGIEGYAAFPLVGTDNRALGLIATLSRQPIEQPRRVETVLRLLAERVVAEVERSGARAALSAAEASYQAIFDAAEDPVFVHDWDSMRVLDVNRKACEVYGYAREELLGIGLEQISAGTRPHTLEDALRWIELAKREGFAQFEWLRRHRDGSLHWDEVRLKAATIGGARRILAFTREITDRKAAEEALRASEALYRSIFDASVDGLALLTPDGVFVDVNAAMQSMSGFTREDLVGHNAVEFLPPQHRAAGRDFIRAVLDEGYAQAEQKTRRKNGVELRLEPRGVPVVYDGRPHLLVIVRDITEARMRQRALERSEDRLRATVDAALDCIVTLDETGVILDFNPASERCFGLPRERALGRPFVDLIVAPSMRAQFRAAFAGFQADVDAPPSARRFTLACRRADGGLVQMELAIGAAASAAGTVFIAYMHDLTPRLEMERTRAELERQLRQAQKMEAIGQLTGGIAHDFNNILTSVIGYIGLALDHGEVSADPALRRYLERARRSGDRARDLIQQMLTYTRGTRGEPQAVEIDELVEEVVTLLDATLPSTIELDLELQRGLPPVLVDPVQAAQALMNLCINARDAMAGQGLLTIRGALLAPAGLRCTSCNELIDGPHVQLSVADTGSGIPPQLLERIFEPFFSTKPTGKGSGMGLATTHGILHQHGGHVVVDSAPGEGTCFSLLLPPVARGARSGGGQPAVLPEATAARLRGRVLLVDDNPSVVEFMQDLLRGWGLEVAAWRDSEAALAAFADDARAFDLALLDQTMPRPRGETSNPLAERLFEILASWTEYLKNGMPSSGADRAAALP